MARFTIIHCRKLQPELSEFDVRVLSGEVLEGDAFSCRGAYQHMKFRVQSIRRHPTDATLVCVGPVAFDDEPAGITLDTHVAQPPSPDLPVLAQYPSPTPEEERTLEVVIEDWESRAPVQRAICLCLLRGDNTPETIGHSLGITADEVKASLRGIWGVLYDRSHGRLFIR